MLRAPRFHMHESCAAIRYGVPPLCAHTISNRTRNLKFETFYHGNRRWDRWDNFTIGQLRNRNWNFFQSSFLLYFILYFDTSVRANILIDQPKTVKIVIASVRGMGPNQSRQEFSRQRCFRFLLYR